jgi:hypothetical protein
MAEIVTLTNQHVQVVKTREPTPTSDDGVEIVDFWTLVMTDRHTGKQIKLALGREARDDVVRQFTDGIVLAGGGLPKIL